MGTCTFELFLEFLLLFFISTNPVVVSVTVNVDVGKASAGSTSPIIIIMARIIVSLQK